MSLRRLLSFLALWAVLGGLAAVGHVWVQHGFALFAALFAAYVVALLLAGDVQ
jgi:hypothetical protein